MATPETLDDLLRPYIVSGGLTAFCDRIGIDAVTLKRIRDRGTVRTATARKIAKGLGLRGDPGFARLVAAIGRQGSAAGK